MNQSLLLLIVTLFLILASCASSEEPEPEVEATFAFQGNWLGRWTDSLFPFISVSATVRNAGGNKYSGSFYYGINGTEPYMACCGGNSDGTITFETKADSVINFVYQQTAPEYRGGCPGTYRGSGVIDKSLNRLIISFRGEDCDGVHENGKMTWMLDK